MADTATESRVTSSAALMRSAIFMDDEEWPTLGGVSDAAANSANCATEDWEMLQQETDLLSFEVVEVREDEEPQSSSVYQQTGGATNNKPINRKMLSFGPRQNCRADTADFESSRTSARRRR